MTKGVSSVPVLPMVIAGGGKSAYVRVLKVFTVNVSNRTTPGGRVKSPNISVRQRKVVLMHTEG